MVNKNPASSIKNALKEIETRYKAKYGAAFFNVKAKIEDNSIILKGTVLTLNQKNEAFSTVQALLRGDKIKNKIKVLGDPKNKLEIERRIIKRNIADIWTVLPCKNKAIRVNRYKIREPDRSTQASKGDIVRILAKKGKWLLMQTNDLTIGWIEKSQTANVKSKMVEQWEKAKRAKFGETLKSKPIKKTKETFNCFFKKYSHAPYVLGGTTEKGIDCSGLVQKFYFDIFGILMPRHSTDQAKMGKDISLKKARFGDLVFLRKKEKNFPHVGIIIKKNSSSEDFFVLNASRDNNAKIQNLSKILEKYKLIGVKKIIKI